MAAPTITTCVEGPGGLPLVATNGLNTLQNINFNSGSNTCDLPASTTINGVAVAGIGNITSSSTTATAFSVTNSGVFTGTSVQSLTANSLTSGSANVISVTGLTTGIGQKVVATAATMTTGRYYSANDTSNGEVFGIGLNGHIISTVGVTPTIAVTTQAGITAAALGTGASDTCGTITTTGTSTGATQITVTFGKTYTTAPKAVILTPANTSAATPNSGYYVDSVSATAFRITVVSGGTYAATPSWYYLVVA